MEQAVEDKLDQKVFPFLSGRSAAAASGGGVRRFVSQNCLLNFEENLDVSTVLDTTGTIARPSTNLDRVSSFL